MTKVLLTICAALLFFIAFGVLGFVALGAVVYTMRDVLIAGAIVWIAYVAFKPLVDKRTAKQPAFRRGDRVWAVNEVCTVYESQIDASGKIFYVVIRANGETMFCTEPMLASAAVQA